VKLELGNQEMSNQYWVLAVRSTGTSVISMRRFLDRPATEVLAVNGLVAPIPFAWIRDGSTPAA
jgi:hypothetical protein